MVWPATQYRAMDIDAILKSGVGVLTELEKFNELHALVEQEFKDACRSYTDQKRELEALKTRLKRQEGIVMEHHAAVNKVREILARRLQPAPNPFDEAEQ